MANSVTDLEETIKSWAWSIYKKARNGNPGSYENTQVDVIWDKVHFVSGQPEFSNIYSSDGVQSQILFSSTFDNEAGQVQHHNFQTSRTTMAIATTKLSKGFTRGVHTGIKLPVPPQVLKATAGFGNYVRIDCEDESTVEHALTWSVNTTVKAPKHLRTIAELAILEQQFSCNFKMIVTFRGQVIVKISDPVSGKMLMVVQNDIATIIRDKFQVSNSNGKSIAWPIEGSVKFQYGVSQNVRVHQKQLPYTGNVDYDDDEYDDGDDGEYYDHFNDY